jgi:hypothetical protein
MNSQFKTVTTARDSAPPAYHTLAPSTTPCKFATTCTRPDCKFAHPARTPARSHVVPARTPGAPARAPAPARAHVLVPAPTAPQFATPALNSAACKFAMKCTRADCKFAHPNPAASVTVRLNASVKMCRAGDECTRADCYFGHASPALFMDKFVHQCESWKNDFYAFWNVDKTLDRDAALAQYFKICEMTPAAQVFVLNCIETAELRDEQHRITAEMEQCNIVDDDADDDDAADADDDADDDDDGFTDHADEYLAADIAAAFANQASA